MRLIQKYIKMIDKTSKEFNIIIRPNASSGFWLCTLLPIAFLVTIIKNPYSSQIFEYRMITITSWGLCLQSINFFSYLTFGGGRILRSFYTFFPGILVSGIFYILLKQNIVVCLVWAITSTLFYQFSYVKTLRALPKSFTYGEASVVVQGVILFLMTSILKIPHHIAEPPLTSFDQMNLIMIEGLICLSLVFTLMYFVKIFRNTYVFYPLLTIAVSIICLIPVTPSFPIVTLIVYIFADIERIFLIIFYAGLIGLAVSAVIWQRSKTEKATTTVRKIFHFIMIGAFVPGLIYQCTLLYLLTGIALALLMLLEVFRVAEIYPFHESLDQSVKSFTDMKDVGLIAFTPLYLLVGCSLPLWIHSSPCLISDATVSGVHLIVMLSGVISIGVGDTIASIFGSKFGSHKWWSSEKSIEGTVASIVVQLLFISALCYLQLVVATDLQLFIISSTVVVVSIIEAITDQVDNLVLPLCFYILVSLA